MSLTKVVGKSVFYAALQAALGSVLMSSSYSVKNFSKDQETLQNAADALREYLIVAFVWTFATCLVLYSDYGLQGAAIGFVANFAFIFWIYYTYVQAFKYAANKYGLAMPRIF